MNPAEAERLRPEILGDLGPLLCDEFVADMCEKKEVLGSRFDADKVEVDVETLTARWLAHARPIGAARATVLGTFSRAPRTWAWAWSNPSLADSGRRACAALTDALGERALWEITTPTFATDEPTAWSLAA